MAGVGLALLVAVFSRAPSPSLPEPEPVVRPVSSSVARFEVEPVEPEVAPEPAESPPDGVAQAFEAVTRALGGGWVRCSAEHLELGPDPSGLLQDPQRAEWDGSVLTLRVDEAEGMRVLTDEERTPRATLSWWGAEDGERGGCRFAPPESIRVSGVIESETVFALNVMCPTRRGTVELYDDDSFDLELTVGESCLFDPLAVGVRMRTVPIRRGMDPIVFVSKPFPPSDKTDEEMDAELIEAYENSITRHQGEIASPLLDTVLEDPELPAAARPIVERWRAAEVARARERLESTESALKSVRAFISRKYDDD